MSKHDAALANIKRLVLELRLALDELENGEEPEPPPANVVPIRGDEYQLTGIIGRPVFKQPNGKSLWVAGIGVSNGRGGTDWHNAVCWGILAEFAREHINRGELVQLVGRDKTENYVDANGVMRHKETFLISRFVTQAAEVRDSLNART